jgi:hypothetical protein
MEVVGSRSNYLRELKEIEAKANNRDEWICVVKEAKVLRGP